MDKCEWLHQQLESLPLFKYPINYDKLPNNGIYFFYEAGEFYTHGNKKQKRIVRVGTHRVNGNFRSRIRSHYRGNKNSSVFRMHLGGALTRRKNLNDHRLEQWLTQNSPTFKDIEIEVDGELMKHFSFKFISVDTKQERMRLEEEMIATLSACQDCCSPSANWLGYHAAHKDIQKSGLWNSQHVNSSNLLTEESTDRIKILIGKNSKKKRALFLIPCCLEKAPFGKNPSWEEIRHNPQFNKFQFLDDMRQKLINFYSNLNEKDGLDYYKRYAKNFEKKMEKRQKAWNKNLLIPKCKTIEAINRYNGNLYSSLSDSNKELLRTGKIDNVFIVSALMGIIAPTDLIPDYELMMTDKSPNMDKVNDFWRKSLLIDGVKIPLEKILSKFDYVYCLMSTTTGYVASVSEILQEQQSYCVLCPGEGQNSSRIWGMILNNALINDVSSPEELQKLTDKYNCVIKDLNNSKIVKLRLPTKGKVSKMGRSKYYGLKTYLENIPKEQSRVTLSFEKIEEILGMVLPKSATTHRPWWANGGHSQANAWLEAEWLVDNVILGKNVSFRRKISPPKQEVSPSSVSKKKAEYKTIKTDNVFDLIRELYGLKEDGIISKEEFEKKKKDLLDRI